MRHNLPVTQREYALPEDATLLSTTDVHSRITYANAAFVAVSGFDRDELTGQPHNLVRHPDMPPEAFADMWATLRAGLSWTALVKNRRKDGDHYWVRANATPIRRGGAVVGYMSVRTRPTRREVDDAEALYQRMREGRAGARRFHQGLVLRTGWLSWLDLGCRVPLRWRLRAVMATTMTAATALAAASGLPSAALAVCAMGFAALGMLGTALLESQVARPLQQVLRQALDVAAGQPGENVQLRRVDEIGMLMRAVNQAGLNLQSLVGDVQQQVAGITGASADIARGNGDLNARTEETASSLEQTAASMEQMNASVRVNADSAYQVSTLAGTASEAARLGQAVVERVVQTMRAISGSSQRIEEIIGVIDGIAFQTNILALNAAVEAARAGEQGRGFAVVASEVRSLAQRSALAAKEIKSLISASVEGVQDGARQAADAGAAMTTIVGQVSQVRDLVAQISEATREQSGGIGQVNAAVSQLDRMTQQNAALVEQSTGASRALDQRARRLAESIGVFAQAASPSGDPAPAQA